MRDSLSDVTEGRKIAFLGLTTLLILAFVPYGGESPSLDISNNSGGIVESIKSLISSFDTSQKSLF